jgi:hypothetical protein
MGSIVGCLCNVLIFLIISGAATVALLYFTDNLGSLSDDLDDELDKIFTVDSDPFQGFTVGNASRWDTSGYSEGGLRMELWNACDDKWTSYFERAVSEWDAGTPDVLTLTTSRVDVDTSCTGVDGIIKVCNGDFGDSQWRGINEILTENELIVSSTAKMNDFYLDKETDAHRQMTMCHEVCACVFLASFFAGSNNYHSILTTISLLCLALLKLYPHWVSCTYE